MPIISDPSLIQKPLEKSSSAGMPLKYQAKLEPCWVWQKKVFVFTVTICSGLEVTVLFLVRFPINVSLDMYD